MKNNNRYAGLFCAISLLFLVSNLNAESINSENLNDSGTPLNLNTKIKNPAPRTTDRNVHSSEASKESDALVVSHGAIDVPEMALHLGTIIQPPTIEDVLSMKTENAGVTVEQVGTDQDCNAKSVITQLQKMYDLNQVSSFEKFLENNHDGVANLTGGVFDYKKNSLAAIKLVGDAKNKPIVYFQGDVGFNDVFVENIYVVVGGQHAFGGTSSIKGSCFISGVGAIKNKKIQSSFLSSVLQFFTQYILTPAHAGTLFKIESCDQLTGENSLFLWQMDKKGVGLECEEVILKNSGIFGFEYGIKLGTKAVIQQSSLADNKYAIFRDGYVKGIIEIESSSFERNFYAVYSIGFNGSDTTIKESKFVNHKTQEKFSTVAAVAVERGTLSVKNSDFILNQAGIYAEKQEKSEIANSKFQLNSKYYVDGYSEIKGSPSPYELIQQDSTAYKGIMVYGGHAMIDHNHFSYNDEALILESAQVEVNDNGLYSMWNVGIGGLGSDLTIEKNKISDSLACIVIAGDEKNKKTSLIKDNTLRGCYAAGVAAWLSAKVHFEGNTVGSSYVMQGGYGFYTENMDGKTLQITAANNIFENNLISFYLGLQNVVLGEEVQTLDVPTGGNQFISASLCHVLNAAGAPVMAYHNIWPSNPPIIGSAIVDEGKSPTCKDVDIANMPYATTNVETL